MKTNRVEVDSQKGYALWAESYDHEKNPLIAVEEPYVEKLLKDISYSCVLDAGTGTGRYALKLARQGAAVTAIDNCLEMLTTAKKSARRAKLNIDFRPVSLEEQLPSEADKFDLVLCSLVLTHILNLKDVVSEFHRVCKRGGYLLVTDFHPESLAQGWRTEFNEKGITYQLPNVKYTREDYLETIRKVGFTILQVVDVPTREIPKGYVPEEIIGSYGDVGLCLIILGQKQ